MLGIIGFTTAAIIFLVYSWSFNHLSLKKTNFRVEYYQYAYALLAVACLFWAAGAHSEIDTVIAKSVILGNIAVLLGTISIAYSVVPKKYKNGTALMLLVLSLAFLVLRIKIQPPDPYLDSGVLVFNSTKIVTIVFGLIFACVWLPSSLYVSRLLTDKPYFRPLRSITSFSVVLATLGVVSFIGADTPTLIALSFAVICCSFGPLIGVNYLVRKGAHNAAK